MLTMSGSFFRKKRREDKQYVSPWFSHSQSFTSISSVFLQWMTDEILKNN